jgi:hypothetical protein
MFSTLTPILSVVEQVKHDQSSESHNHVDRRHWLEFIRPFTNGKAIRASFADNLVGYSGGRNFQGPFITSS